jgi:ribosomal protein S18 acetylase RimI-like enzyme
VGELYTEPMPDTRCATILDAQLIASHRRAMFASMGGFDEAVLDAVLDASGPWTERMMREGRYLGWITEDHGRPVASAGMLILDWAPHPLDPAGEKRAYLLNVFVDPAYRRRGLARKLMEICLEEARGRGIRVVALHASEEGAHVYAQLGFKTTNEMIYRFSQ